MSLSDGKHAEIIDAINTTFRYLDDIFNIHYIYFENMVSHIYPKGQENFALSVNIFSL